jgi:hypothetical protein
MLPAGRAPMNAFVASVAAECPQALAGAPVSARLEDKEGTLSLSDQAVLMFNGLDGLEIAQQSVDASAVQKFATALQRLHWHNRQLTALVHTFGQIETERVHMHTPDLCGQIKAWAESGYRTLSQALEEPLEPRAQMLAEKLTAAIGCGPFDSPEHAIVAVLRHYQRAGERPTTRQVEVAEFHSDLAALRASGPAAGALEHALDPHFLPKLPKKRDTAKFKGKLPAPYPACSGRPERGSSPR